MSLETGTAAVDAMLVSELRAPVRVGDEETDGEVGRKEASSRLNHNPNRTLAERFCGLRDSDRHRHARVCSVSCGGSESLFWADSGWPAESASEVPDRRGPCPGQFGREWLDPGSRKWRSVHSHTVASPRVTDCDHHFGTSIVVRIGSAAASPRTCRALTKELSADQAHESASSRAAKALRPEQRTDRSHPPICTLLRPCRLPSPRHVGCARSAR